MGFPALKQHHQLPEVRMKDRISAGYIKIWQLIVNPAKILTVSHNLLHLLPCHALKLAAALSRKNVAVLTALVTFICYMPLKRKIIHPILHSAGTKCLLPAYCLSPAPHAVPACFFSFSFHPKMFNNAILMHSFLHSPDWMFLYFSNPSSLLHVNNNNPFPTAKVRTFLLHSY